MLSFRCQAYRINYHRLYLGHLWIDNEMSSYTKAEEKEHAIHSVAHTAKQYLSFFMLNKCEKKNIQIRHKKKRTTQANDFFFVLCVSLFQKKKKNRLKIAILHDYAKEKILEHDEMQILLQIAIIISEWRQEQKPETKATEHKKKE